VQELLSGRRLYISTADEDELKYRRFLRFDSFDAGEDWLRMRSVLLPNMTMFDSIASLNNFDPLVPVRYSRWMAILSHARGREREMLLDLSGVGVVERRDVSTDLGVRFQQLPEEIGSRARWVPCARAAQDQEQALQFMVSDSFDPAVEVILEGYGSQSDGDCSDTGAEGTVELVSELPGMLVFRVLADQPGWLLLSDVWYPGWHATVDGVEAPLLRADYLFRSVQIPIGDHRVRIDYRPSSFYLGLALSLITLLVVFGFEFKSRR
jgi:hypothetical protein